MFSSNFNKLMLKHLAFIRLKGSLGSLRPQGRRGTTTLLSLLLPHYFLIIRKRKKTCHKTKTLINSESIFLSLHYFCCLSSCTNQCVRRFASARRPSSVRSAGCGSLSHPHWSACWAEGSRSVRGVGGKKENKTTLLSSLLYVPPPYYISLTPTSFLSKIKTNKKKFTFFSFFFSFEKFKVKKKNK